MNEAVLTIGVPKNAAVAAAVCDSQLATVGTAARTSTLRLADGGAAAAMSTAVSRSGRAKGDRNDLDCGLPGGFGGDGFGVGRSEFGSGCGTRHGGGDD